LEKKTNLNMILPKSKVTLTRALTLTNE